MTALWDTLLYVFPYAIALAMPLAAAALGGLFSERAGVVNIALEGLMLSGCFTSALFSLLLYDIIGGSAIWLSIPAAMLGGAFVALPHAVACVRLRADPVVSGTALNLLTAALTPFLARLWTGSGSIAIPGGGLSRFDIPIRVPVLGPILFTGTYATTWLILLLYALGALLLYRTPFGTRLRACGDNAEAAEAAGIRVSRIRTTGIVLSGALSGLGGAAWALCFGKEFSGSLYGMGFLALAALVFGRHKPLGTLGACLFFGFTMSLSNISSALPGFIHVPGVLLKIFPYVATLVMLMVTGWRRKGKG